MGDDLSAFFAKKAQKKSKKKIVSLDDVGQQLERKVKIQETGELDLEDVDSFFAQARESKENVLKQSNINNNSKEDSEWIEVSEKPIVTEKFVKEFTDNVDDEQDDEKKDAGHETVKTWNLPEKEASEEIVAPAPIALYRPRQAVAPLDLNNQENFPSIADADAVAEKLKAEEKIRMAAGLKAEDDFEVTKRPGRRDFDNSRDRERYEPPREGRYNALQQRSGDRFERGGGGRRQAEPEPSESDEATNWRLQQRPPARVTALPPPPRQQTIERQMERQPIERPPPKTTTEADESSNWRSSKKAAALPLPQAKNAATNDSDGTNEGSEGGGAWQTVQRSSGNTSSATGAYVPPHLRKKHLQ